jgi:hypothetical protein
MGYPTLRSLRIGCRAMFRAEFRAEQFCGAGGSRFHIQSGVEPPHSKMLPAEHLGSASRVDAAKAALERIE